jgi:hypothetical protein
MSLSTDITSPLTPALSGFQIAARLPAGGLRVEAGSERQVVSTASVARLI